MQFEAAIGMAGLSMAGKKSFRRGRRPSDTGSRMKGSSSRPSSRMSKTSNGTHRTRKMADRVSFDRDDPTPYTDHVLPNAASGQGSHNQGVPVGGGGVTSSTAGSGEGGGGGGSGGGSISGGGGVGDFDSSNDIYGGAVAGNGHMTQPHVPSRPQGAPSSASRVARAAHRRDSSGRALPNAGYTVRKPKPFPRMDIWNFQERPVNERGVKVLTEASVIDPKLLERAAKKEGLELSLQQGKAAKEAAVKVGWVARG